MKCYSVVLLMKNDVSGKPYSHLFGTYTQDDFDSGLVEQQTREFYEKNDNALEETVFCSELSSGHVQKVEWSDAKYRQNPETGMRPS